MTSNPNTVQSRRLGVIGAYVALAAGFGLFGYLPYERSMGENRAQIVRLQDEIQSRQNKIHQLDEMSRQVQLIDLQTRDFDRLVPANKDLGPFLAELSRELDRAGMRDITVSAMPATPLGKAQRLPIEVKGKGTYAQFHDFLVHLEGLPRKSSVGKLNIDADTDMSGYVTAELMLYIYNTNSGA
jgi:Tfp pilus assembly protein PilO